MKEQLSAFIDGELQSGELQTHLARIKSDTELRRAWNTYHLIGDALRGNVSPDFTSLVVARLHEEPAVLVPSRVSLAHWRLGWYALSAAAGVAAVTLVVWTAFPIWQAETQVTARSENADLARSTPVPATELKASISDAEVENYLYAHQPYSHASAIQGVAPYARTIADERGAASK